MQVRKTISPNLDESKKVIGTDKKYNTIRSELTKDIYEMHFTKKKKFENTKGVIRSRKYNKDRQCNAK